VFSLEASEEPQAEGEVSPLHALDKCEQRQYWDKIEQ
jgi:hypothetical protein